MNAKTTLIIFLGVFCSIAFCFLIFSPGLALLGDISLDDLVDEIDLSAIAQKLGKYETDPGFDRFLDLNLDDFIDVRDLAIAGRSYGSDRNFHFPRKINNSTKDTILMSACIDGQDHIHIIWSESNDIYYTRLDRFGNTLIDDLFLQHGEFSSSTGLAIACDEAGNSHMIWDCSGGNSVCQARVDSYGYLLYVKKLDTEDSLTNWPDIDMDSEGRAHVFYTHYSHAKSYYSVVDQDGELQVSQQTLPKAQRYHELALDSMDNAHLVYPVYTDTFRLAYQRISPLEDASLAPRTIGVLGWEGTINDSIRPSLAVDSHQNAFVSYFSFGTLPTNLYLEKISPDGSSLIDDKLILPEYDNGATGGAQTDIALDSEDNLHLFSFTDFVDGTGAAHSAYGIFDNFAETLQPVRMTIYGNTVTFPTILVDSFDDSEVIYKSGYASGYPPCEEHSLCFQGTSFEPSTYDLSLPDLGTDVAHLAWEPLILKWNSTAVITGTVFNSGWSAAPATSLRASLSLSDDESPPLVSTDVAIPSLLPYQSYQFTANLALPKQPDEGFEDLVFLRLLLAVDPGQLIVETSEQNNQTSSPVPIKPIPTRTSLYIVIHDETSTVIGVDASSELINTGSATIEGPGYSQKAITISDYHTVLASDIPVEEDEVLYTVTWEGAGYADAPPVQIGVKRNVDDPYRIDYSPRNTAVLVTNRWGSLSGMITSAAGGDGLPSASVRLVGQVLSLEVLTDEKGSFSPATTPKLGTLIPGDYQVRVSLSGYARLVDNLTVLPLQETKYEESMQETNDAYLHGNVVNTFGNPVPNAQLNTCGVIAVTDDQGIFDMQVKANCTTLEISRAFYNNASEPLSLTAGLEALLPDLILEFESIINFSGGGDRVASRVIDMSTGGMLPDAPADAGFALNQLYELFQDEFWIDYRILIFYGCYEYNLSAAYSGAPGDYHLEFVQVNIKPKTFEIHMSLGSIEFLGVTIPIPIVSDSGLRTAVYGIESRLVNTETGESVDITRKYLESEDEGSWLALDDTTITYIFDNVSFSNLDDYEVWFYLKIGLNNGGYFKSSPLLYQYNQQILKLNLESGTIVGSYALGDFPIP